MKYKTHPWDKRGPNMVLGFDHDGNRVAIEVVPSLWQRLISWFKQKLLIFTSP